MSIESTISTLHKEHLLTVCSCGGVIPAITAGAAQLYAMLVPFHDIGKRAVPSEIRNKHGQLTCEEFEVMKTHTTRGCEFLEQIPPLRQSEAFPLACDVCRHHHERWDGSGYPDYPVGREIAPWVQVVGLADAFDALLHPRVYKPPYLLGQAIRMIESGACGIFDPAMLACFTQTIGHICHTVYA